MRGATLEGKADKTALAISTHTPHAGRDRIPPLLECKELDFNSHAPCGARQASLSLKDAAAAFQLTRPMRGATKTACNRTQLRGISTHTPHAGRDRAHEPEAVTINKFQLTRPMRGATYSCSRCTCYGRFQLTRPMRGATQTFRFLWDGHNISTHTPHAGRDFIEYFDYILVFISTHTPHAGRDPIYCIT